MTSLKIYRKQQSCVIMFVSAVGVDDDDDDDDGCTSLAARICLSSASSHSSISCSLSPFKKYVLQHIRWWVRENRAVFNR
jgi:hypothetical protein